MKQCEICGQGELIEKQDLNQVSQVPCLYYVCNACGIEQADSRQTDFNAKAMRNNSYENE